jgi:hypothetical protein
MSATLTLPRDNKVTLTEMRPTRAQIEFGDNVPEPSSRYEDELWPWVQLPDGRLELVADAA